MYSVRIRTLFMCLFTETVQHACALYRLRGSKGIICAGGRTDTLEEETFVTLQLRRSRQESIPTYYCTIAFCLVGCSFTHWTALLLALSWKPHSKRETRRQPCSHSLQTKCYIVNNILYMNILPLLSNY